MDHQAAVTVPFLNRTGIENCMVPNMWLRSLAVPCGGVHWGQLEPAVSSPGQPWPPHRAPAAKAQPPAPNVLTNHSAKNINELPMLTTVGIYTCQFSWEQWWCFVLQLSSRRNCLYLGNTIFCLPLSAFTRPHGLLFSECKCVI